MHRHNITHLDISLRNLVTDYQGHYCYIDYELSQRFDRSSKALIYHYRGTEVPPECEKDTEVDPYKVDVWALAVLILRACKVGERLSNSYLCSAAWLNAWSSCTLVNRILGSWFDANHWTYADRRAATTTICIYCTTNIWQYNDIARVSLGIKLQLSSMNGPRQVSTRLLIAAHNTLPSNYTTQNIIIQVQISWRSTIYMKMVLCFFGLVLF